MATFEDSLSKLEGVVDRLERGELTLDESVRLFEEGMRLSETCKRELGQAEGRVQVLVEGKGGKVQLAELQLEAEEKEFGSKEEEDEEDEEDEE